MYIRGMYIARDIIKFEIKRGEKMVFDYKGRRWLRFITAISEAEFAPTGSSWIPQLHTSTSNRISMHHQAETKALGSLKASKERETLIHFALISLKNSLAVLKEKGILFALAVQLHSTGLKDILLTTSTCLLHRETRIPRISFFFPPASSIIIMLLRARARGGIWITTANNSARFS